MCDSVALRRARSHRRDWLGDWIQEGWETLILCALQGWAIAIGFQLLRYANSPWLGYVVLFLFILALALVLTGGGIFRKREGVE